MHPQIQIGKKLPDFIVVIVCSRRDDEGSLDELPRSYGFLIMSGGKVLFNSAHELASEFSSIEYFKDNDKHMIYQVHAQNLNGIHDKSLRRFG